MFLEERIYCFALSRIVQATRLRFLSMSHLFMVAAYRIFGSCSTADHEIAKGRGLESVNTNLGHVLPIAFTAMKLFQSSTILFLSSQFLVFTLVAAVSLPAPSLSQYDQSVNSLSTRVNKSVTLQILSFASWETFKTDLSFMQR